MPVTEFYRPNPLEGDSIMDATARLLAPRRGSPITQRPVSPQKAANPGKKKRNPSQGAVSPSPVSREPVKAEKAAQSPKHKKKSKGPQEAVRSGHTKDSTEQKSLMKPYYLSF